MAHTVLFAERREIKEPYEVSILSDRNEREIEAALSESFMAVETKEPNTYLGNNLGIAYIFDIYPKVPAKVKDLAGLVDMVLSSIGKARPSKELMQRVSPRVLIGIDDYVDDNKTIVEGEHVDVFPSVSFLTTEGVMTYVREALSKRIEDNPRATAACTIRVFPSKEVYDKALLPESRVRQLPVNYVKREPLEK